MIIYGTAKDLQFKPDNIRAWLLFLEQNDGKKLVLDVNREKSKRSLDQNAYLWGVVYKVIADHTGYSETEVHEVFKRMFLPPRFIKWKGREIKLPNTTTELNKAEFGEYITRIQAEVADMGITIPNAQ